MQISHIREIAKYTTTTTTIKKKSVYHNAYCWKINESIKLVLIDGCMKTEVMLQLMNQTVPNGRLYEN